MNVGGFRNDNGLLSGLGTIPTALGTMKDGIMKDCRISSSTRRLYIPLIWMSNSHHERRSGL